MALLAPLASLPRWMRTRWFLLAVGLFAVAAGAGAYDAIDRSLDARRELLAARSELTAARETLQPVIQFDASAWPSADDFRSAQAHLAEAQHRIQRARARLGYVESLANLLGWLPVWGPQLGRVPDVLDVGQEVTAVVSELLTVAEPLFVGGEFIADSARDVFVLHQHELLAALDRLDVARLRAQELRATRWRGPLAEVASMLMELDEELRRVPEAQELVTLLGDGLDALLGYGTPARYVILGQNDHEIRATGGFVGTIGFVTLEDGQVTESEYRGISDFDPPPDAERRPAPETLALYSGSSEWWIKEVNHYPHFPGSAELALQFLSADFSIAADGVIAVDSEMVRLLLEVFGPVDLPEFDEPLSADNWFFQVEASLLGAKGVLTNPDAKEAYLRPVLRVLLARAQAASRDEIPGLLRALREGVEGRHIQLFSRTTAVQRVVEQFGADGSMPVTPGEDFLAVVDSNFSHSKVQPAILRTINYVQGDDHTVELTVTWRNVVPTFPLERFLRLAPSGTIFDINTGIFRPAPSVFGNFARVYLPPGSLLLSIDGFDSAPRYELEFGLAVVGGFVEVGPGDERTVRLRYLPWGDDAGPLRGVRLWKQGGAFATSLRVARAEGDGEVVLYEGSLDRDLWFAFP